MSHVTEDAEPQPAEAGGQVRARGRAADAPARLLVRLVAHHALQPVAQGLCARARTIGRGSYVFAKAESLLTEPICPSANIVAHGII